MKEEIMSFLSQVAPFSFLSEDQLERIIPLFSKIHYPRNTVIFVQGRSKIDHLYIIYQGIAERYFEEKDRKIMLEIMTKGDIYGGISMLLNHGVAVRTLKTRENTNFYILPKDAFMELCNENEAFSEFFTDKFGKRMVDKSYSAMIYKMMKPDSEALQFFDQPISNLYNRHIVSCNMDLSIRDAARLMTQNKCSSILIKSPTGEYIGIVTDNDLRQRVIAKGVDPQRPVSEIMSSPLQTMSVNSQVFETLMKMVQDDVKHLGVKDSEDNIIGIISNKDLLLAQSQSPFFLIRELNFANSIEEIVEKNSKLPQMVQSLINTGAKAKNITKFITSISEVVLNKLIGFALESLGEPPVPFVFMILGSEGRKEQTLKTDQDNAIIFEDVPEDKLPEVKDYFLKFGEKVCSDLNRAGYAFCSGDIMAKNPKWCQPLSVWKQYFSSWIYTAEAEDLLQSSIFFDFRGGYGDMNLIDALRKFLFDSLEGWQGFFRHLTENALHFKPPLGFFRNFVVESKGDHRDAFDIKGAMMPIVDFARIYALHNRIDETNTLERLHQLNIKNVLSWNDYKELEQAYGYLMQLRFVRQVTAIIEEKREPNNYVNPKKLTNIEQKMLKEIFRKIEKFQDKMNFDFIGIF